MRIAYSCAGEGLGHAARMVVLGPQLASRHHITYFVPQTVLGFLQKKLPGFTAHAIPGLAFTKKRDRVDLLATAAENLPLLLRFPLIIRRLAAQLRKDRIEAVISDFDPFLAWAAWTCRIPVFQYNHPGVVSDCMTWEPVSWIHALAAKFLEGPWTSRAHISFYRSTIGPLYRPSLFKTQPSRGNHILVNLTKESFRKPLLGFLARHHPELEIQVFPDPARDFEHSLATCRAVISPAGHQMIAESMLLGKPILALPQQGQWEQVVNARMLAATGRGMASSIDRLKRDLPRFLQQLDRMAGDGKPLPDHIRLQDGSARLQKKIDAFLMRLTKATPWTHEKLTVVQHAGLAPVGGGASNVVPISSFGQAGQPSAAAKTGSAELPREDQIG